jgi:hypothetical protein
MLSTYLGYQLYANDLSKSLQRVAGEGANKNAKAYYDANIGKVKNVDGFINNYKLFSYAMKAYGLEDMTYAKGLIRQVLTSDLSNPKSVANKLSDPRYLAFAKAFSFTTTGAVASTSIQSTAQQDDTVALFQANMGSSLNATTLSDATAYYKSHIGSVTSVAALQKDQKLYAYVQAAYNLDNTMSDSTFASVVESNLADPKSVINTTSGSGYLALQQAVNVSSSGGASTTLMRAQTTDQTDATIASYSAQIGTDSASQGAGSTETAYFSAMIATATSVTDITGNDRLVAYIKKAYDLPSTMSAGTLQQILTSDLSDPTSVASRSSDPNVRDAAKAFNFATDGSLRTLPFQTAAQQQETVALHDARLTSDTPAAEADTAYYAAHIGSVTSVSDLESDSRLLNYVLSAYGVGTSTPTATVEQVLEQSPTASGSVIANTTSARDLVLARGFDVDPQGNSVQAFVAQNSTGVSATTSAYLSAAGSNPASVREASYYKAAIANVTSVTSLLSDTRLVTYLKKAYGLPASTTTGQMQQALTSNLMAANNAATKLGDNFVKLAEAFQFGTNGLVAVQAGQRGQSTAQQTFTDLTFTRQNLEDEAGQDNTGIKLALYFQRVAPTITNAYSVLADKALLEVFQTMLGLSSTSSKADIDVQARFLKSKINFADLKDPAKVTKMVQRFAAVYDMTNSTSGSADTVSMLFGGGG